MEKIREKFTAKDQIGVSRGSGVTEKLEKKVLWQITRYASEADRLAGKVYSAAEAAALFGIAQSTSFEHNALLNEGLNMITTLLCSSGGTKFDSSNAYLGVGDDTTAVDVTQTGLQAAVNKMYKAMSSGYPTYGTEQKMVFRSSFGASEANFSWNEFSLANGNSDSSTNMNRKVEAQGTKTSGQTWDIILTITLA